MDAANTISTSGYNSAGRRVFINLAFAPDASVDDIAKLIVGVEMICQQAGLSVREQGVEAGEQTKEIRYLLRRKQKNEDGSFSPIIDMYSGNFRWVATWLNTPDEIAAFENACGVKLDRMPISLTQVKEYDPSDPDIANLFTVLGTPAQIVYKDNPKWHEGLTDAEKLKVSKRLFVRWLTAAPAPIATPPLAIAQKLPPATQQAAETFGSGSQGRRIPTGAENAANDENGRSGAKWAYDFQSLMKHLDVARQIPQSNHRAATITLLNNSNVFDDVPDLNIAAYRVNAYSAFRTQGMEEAQAIAAVMETETF